jgi:alkaline phosphatase D
MAIKTQAPSISRRALLQAASVMAAAAIGAPPGTCLAVGQPRFANYPFSLGVASGDPVSDGFVLWTRLAPDPLEGGGMAPEAVPVRWEVAEDERFRRIVRQGETLARPELAHSVHVDVQGLQADRWYFYRFVAGGEVSPLGRTRTFPAIGSAKDRFRFAFASCQHFGQGFFTAYDAMMNDDLDLIVHLGDYIYESDWGQKVRFHLPEPETLEAYRNHHALYKSDTHLQAAHAWHPFAVTWDDHEVDNDYAGDQSEDRMPPEKFLKRRAAAYQAYYEHMPLRRTARPDGPSMTLYTSLNFGDLASIAMLDNRQYRADQACQGPERFGGQLITDCAERDDPARTILGPLQERWLLGHLARTRGKWKVIGQQTLMAPVDQKQGEGSSHWSDGWDGYPAARQRILSHIASRNISDVVVVGGDIHSFCAADLKADFADAKAAPIATEFVATSVTSASGLSNAQVEKYKPENPHIKFFDSQERGYALATVTPGEWRTEFRAVSGVTTPEATARTLQSFAVEAGKPGVQS